MNHHATGAKPPTQVITIDDLNRQIERFEAMIKEIRPQLHALVALKRSLTMRRARQDSNLRPSVP